LSKHTNRNTQYADNVTDLITLFNEQQKVNAQGNDRQRAYIVGLLQK